MEMGCANWCGLVWERARHLAMAGLSQRGKRELRKSDDNGIEKESRV